MLNKKKMAVSFAIIIASFTLTSASAFANMSLCEDIAEAKESGSLNLAKELTSLLEFVLAIVATVGNYASQLRD